MKIRSSIDSINLESINNNALDLSKNYIFNLDCYVMDVASVLMLLVNIFWFVVNFIKRTPVRSTVSYLGIIHGIIFPVVTLLFLMKRKPDNYSWTRVLVIVFHLFVIAMTTFLNLHIGTTSSGIPLSMFWLLICALVPMISLVDSAIVMLVLFLSTFLPNLILFGSGNVNWNNLMVAVCIIASYFGFRLFAISNSRLIQALALTSYYDHQTGVLNKRALKEYLANVKNKNVTRIGVMLYDIDDFKAYNDKYSHEQGDKMLLEISDIVSMFLKGEGAMVFRHGGGDFVAIMEDISDDRLLKVALKAKEIVEDMKIERNDGTIRKYVTITVGCASANLDDNVDILSDVDTQRVIGKKGTKDCVVFNGRIYVAEGEITTDQQPTLYTERVAAAVAEAMKHNELKIFIQPMYDTTTQNMVGSEALSRWVKPDGTIIRPSEYIPELEKNSSILALDWFMFEETCRVIKRIKDMGLPPIRISVNFSRMHVLYERDIEKRLCEIADSYGVNHNLVEIEITESAYIHLPTIIEPIIRGIRNAGFAVAIDDFGSGASSLEFINTVDVDTLKIDKSLISSNCSDEKERVLLESVVLLAHRLQLNSIAEGVETVEQLGFLKTIGCKQIQGFIFSKPLPEEDYIELYKKEAKSHETYTSQVHEVTSGQSSLQILVDTVFKEYPTVLISNLSKNSYYAMSYEAFTDHRYPQAGILSSLLEEVIPNLAPEYREVFGKEFTVEKKLEAFRNGEDKFTYQMKLKDKDGYKTIDTVTYFIQEKGDEDVLAVTLCSESN